ncbi:hypothetical protein BUMB_04493c [Candidatus Paraburkholderia calva]|nr:hypothetical protein BUMB_04493c [Candidatus Paraburkholderia calva]
MIGDTQAALDAALVAKRSLTDELSTFFEMSIDNYLFGAKSRGCLVTSTTLAEAIESPAVQLALRPLIAALDEAFETRFRVAQERGEIGSSISAAMRGRQATAMVQELGASRTQRCRNP